jgi:hypothetical protein
MHCRSVLFIPMFVLCFAAGCANHSSAKSSTSEHGFKPLFNGKDLSGWTYARTPEGKSLQAGDGYHVRPEDGVIYCTVTDGGRLMTEKEYANFDLRFDFKLSENANNGIGIRASTEGNPAYRGMEIQVLDDSGSKYTALRPAQYHGSIYDVVPAERGHQKPVGEWNSEEIIANGRQITVILNGATIVDANLDKITDEHVLAKHPGLQNKSGRIELLGHGAAVEFRNMRLKNL